MHPDFLKYPREAYISQCTFETSKSGGKGGQHVNKTETKVTLVFDLKESDLFDEDEKLRIEKKMSSHFHSGVIRISAETSRSQIQNKKIAIQRFFELLEKALYQSPKRIPVKISKAQKAARLKTKKIESEKKKARKKINPED